MLKADKESLSKKSTKLENKIKDLEQNLKLKNDEIQSNNDSYLKMQKRIESMEDIMVKYNNLKASLEQLQLNYDAIKKTTNPNKIAQFETEYNQMLNDLKVYEERIQSLEEKINDKDKQIEGLLNQVNVMKIGNEKIKNDHEDNYTNYMYNLKSQSKYKTNSSEKQTFDNLYSFGNYKD